MHIKNRPQRTPSLCASFTRRVFENTSTRRSTRSPDDGLSKSLAYRIILTCCFPLPMPYMLNSGGQTVMPLLHGMSLQWLDRATTLMLRYRILGLVAAHTPTMPLHIACMHHLSHLHSKLFILAHELVDREPESATSWYAVGVWYLTQKKWSDARTYFRCASSTSIDLPRNSFICSKTSLMDPRLGPAWIAFAHTFAFEGEHDHAVTAYSTCARMFTGYCLLLFQCP